MTQRLRHYLPFILKQSIWLLLITMVVIFSFTANNFLTLQNMINILSYASILGIMVIGQSLVLITGNMDLSMESTLGLCGLLGVWLISSRGDPQYGSGLMVPPILAIFILMSVGVVIGWINGNLITRFKINNFVVTLSMLIALRGVMYIITSGSTVYSNSVFYNSIGIGKLGIINYPVLIMLGLFVVAYLVLKYTQFGRELFAVGANRQAALASGINPDTRIRQVYLISAGLAALTGLLLSARLTNVIATMGKGTVFEVFAAAVIGGVSLQGGIGTIVGAFGGVLLLSTINSGLNLMEVNVFWVEVVRGMIILLAMLIDAQKIRFIASETRVDNVVKPTSPAPAAPN
jgi:ribose/xylose/arabinose/galactoside ABC-type transport system permease subunit